MAVFLLIRHGQTEDVKNGILSGRTPGVHLDEFGKLQAGQIADRLSGIALDMVCSSPVQRAVETATTVAEKFGLEVQIIEALNEVNSGNWTGREIEKLDQTTERQQFNIFRSGKRIPDGEMMIEVQNRIVAEMESLNRKNPDAVISLFSHADVIKAAIANYAGIHIDFLIRFRIDTASISILELNDWGANLKCLNHTGVDRLLPSKK